MLKKIVLKACDFKPENRYHTAMEMLEDLNQVEAALLLDSGNASDPENSTITGETMTGESVGTIGGTWAADVGDHRYPDSPSGPSMTENSSQNNSFYGSGNSVYNSGEEPTVYNDSFRYEPEASFREEPSGVSGRFRKLSTPILLGAGALIVVLALVMLLGGKGNKHIISVFNDDEVTSADEPQTTTDANGNVITIPGSSGKSGGSSGNSKSDGKTEDADGGANLWDIIGGLFAGGSSDSNSNSSNSDNKNSSNSGNSSGASGSSTSGGNSGGTSGSGSSGSGGSGSGSGSGGSGGSSDNGGSGGSSDNGGSGSNSDNGGSGSSGDNGGSGSSGDNGGSGNSGDNGGSGNGGDNGGSGSSGDNGGSGNSGDNGGSGSGGDNGGSGSGGDNGGSGSGGDSGGSGGGSDNGGSGGESVVVESSGAEAGSAE